MLPPTHKRWISPLPTREQEEEICIAYEARRSIQAVAAMYSMSRHVIAYTLKKYGRCIGARRGYMLDETVFDRITPLSAYWLGFLLGDGCIHKRILTVELAAYDVTHLETFRDFLRANHPIQHVKPYRTSGPQVRLSIRSVYLATALGKYGIVERKTRMAQAHPLMQNNAHFWRGIIDADGSLGQRGTWKNDAYIQLACTSETLVKQFATFIHTLIPACRATAFKEKRVDHWHFMVTGPYARRVLVHLYAKAHVALPRKLLRAQSLIDQQLYMPFL